jgi:vacuolar-type H+-ATPase subunit C/Vma6
MAQSPNDFSSYSGIGDPADVYILGLRFAYRCKEVKKACDKIEKNNLNKEVEDYLKNQVSDNLSIILMAQWNFYEYGQLHKESLWSYKEAAWNVLNKYLKNKKRPNEQEIKKIYTVTEARQQLIEMKKIYKEIIPLVPVVSRDDVSK